MSQISKFSYNGCEYEFDVRDADAAEKFETAAQTLQLADKSMPKDGKASSQIRYQCGIIKRFFDDCLGPGAGTAICGDRDNAGICTEAYAAFLNIVKAQKNELLRVKGTFSQYSNRQQRRHPQNGKQGWNKPNQPK